MIIHWLAITACALTGLGGITAVAGLLACYRRAVLTDRATFRN